MTGRPLRIEWHEDEQTLEQRYKQEKDYQNRARLQALWLIRRGASIRRAAEIVGYAYPRVQAWVGWYRQGGLEAVLRRRRGGRRPHQRRLSAEQEEQLKARAAQGEIRTIGEAVEWVKQAWGIEYTYWGMRWVFARLKLTKKVPRPRAVQASEEAQQAWKKKSSGKHYSPQG